MITIAVIESNRMVRENVSSMLEALDDVSVLLASDAVCFELLQCVAPRVLLLNSGLSHAECLRIASRSRQELSGCHVVVTDLSPDHNGIAQLINAGVSGFILRDATRDEFVQTLRDVATGDSVLPPRMLGSLFAQLANASETGRASAVIDVSHLTPREREVIALIAQGRSNKEIAVQLAIADHTVKTHVRNVMEKLSLNTRLQIAAYAHKQSG